MRLFTAAALVSLAFAVPSAALEVSLDPGAPISASTGQIFLNADYIQQSGAKWARVNFILGPWSSPSDSTKRGPQNLTWKQTYDQIINNLIAKDIQPYALVGAEAVKSSHPLNSNGYVNDYASNFATIVGQFRDRIRVYESFNEPNDWAGGTTAQVEPYWFAKMLQEIYLRVKVNDGHWGDPTWQVTLVSGPLFSHDLDNVAAYFNQVYQAGKSQLSWNSIKTNYGSFPLDGIGYHIYVAQGASSEATVTNKINGNLNAIWGTITTHEGSGTAKKLWVSEFGWNTASVSEAEQARNLTLAYNLFLNDPRIQFANWFQIADFGYPNLWGLLRSAPPTSSSNKPSWDAFVAFATASNPTTGTIAGIVLDSNNDPIAGALVETLTGGYSTTTGADGTYQIDDVEEGPYAVKASKFGYRYQTKATLVEAGATAHLDFTLLGSQEVSSAGAIKMLPSSTFVRLNGVIVTAALANGRRYVQRHDRSSGIGVLGISSDEGDLIDVAGYVSLDQGEVLLSSAEAGLVSFGNPLPAPLAMSSKRLGGGALGYQLAVADDVTKDPVLEAGGLNNVGLLVTVHGRVSAVDEGGQVFYLDDGAQLRDGSGYTGVRVDVSGIAPPAVSLGVAVTGISSVMRLSGNIVRVLRPRTPADIAVLWPAS